MTKPMREFPAMAITGIAASCALGADRFSAVQAITDDQVGFSKGDALEQLPEQVISIAQAREAAPVVGCAPDRAEQLLGRAIRDAMSDAGYDHDDDSPNRAVVLGTTLGGARHIGEALRKDDLGPYGRVNNGAVAFHTLESCGLPRGAITLSGACASGLTTVINAALLIASGQTDVAVAAGYDPISEFSLGGFRSLRLVAPDRSMPFESDRSGMKIGEGYGALVLEHPERALKRGARIHAWLVGWGERSDAYHLTHPQPEGEGAAHALQATLARAGTDNTPHLMMAHATATPANDEAEYAAYSQVFQEQLAEIPVCALKSRIGHALGGAGAVELVLGLTALEQGFLPTTGPGETDGTLFPNINVQRGEVSPTQAERISVLSLGFGGADACVLVDRNRPEEAQDTPQFVATEDKAVITGISALLPGIGRRSGLQAGENLHTIPGPIDLEVMDGLDDPRAVRRLAILARLARAGARLAAEDANLDDAMITECHAIMATFHGPIPYTLGHYNALLEDGVEMGNPLFFAESVPNIASAQTSLALGIRGSTNTIFGTRTSGLEAMHLARLRIESGMADRVIVVAVEEYDELTKRVLDHHGLLQRADGTSEEVGGGAIGFVLERASIAAERGATPMAQVTESALDWPHEGGAHAHIINGRKLVSKYSNGRAHRVTSSHSMIGRIERLIARPSDSESRDIPELHSVAPFFPVLEAVSKREPTLLVGCDYHGATAVIALDPC